MRKTKAIFLVCLLLVSSSGCRKKLLALGVDIETDVRKLPNGLTVVMVEDHTVPVISYQTWFRVGSVDERPGITGISHLFEHLMFKGTPKYSAKEFFLQLEAKGAEVNAYTMRDYTVYYESFTPQLLEKVVDMESDRMANLTLTDQVLNTERQVVFEERRMRTDNSPSGKVQEALWSLAYEVHPYQWPVIGYPEDLTRITTEQLIDYFKKHYTPSNAVVVIVGDIKPDAAFELVTKHYGGIEKRAAPERKTAPEPEQKGERRLVLYDHIASEKFAQAYHVSSAQDDDSYAMDVLANILFAGTSSRAYRKIVDEQDIALSVNGTAYTPTYPGLFMITGTMKGDLPASDAEKSLDQLIQDVQENPVTEDEIKVAVRQLTVDLVDGVRTPYGMGQLIGTVMMVFGHTQRFSEDLEKYLKVTVADVQRVAKKYLVPNNRSVVTLMPESKRPRK